MTIPAHIRLGETGAEVTSDKKGKGIVKAAYKLNSVILIKGESRNSAGSNMGVEDGEEAIEFVDMIKIIAIFVAKLDTAFTCPYPPIIM